LEIDYEIGIANHKIISVLIKVYFMKSSMPHPFDLYQSLNFDLQNSKQFILGEHYNIDDSFVDIFVNYSKTQLRENGIREGYEEPLFETLFEDVNEKFYKIDEGNATNFCSYFTENHLVIIEQTIYAIGSHIESLIDYNEIESYLKPISFLYNDFSL